MQAWLIVLILSSLIGGGAWFYWDWSQDKIFAQGQEIVQLEEAVKSNELIITQLKENAIDQYEANVALEKELQTSDDYKNELLRILRSHDLTALAKAKPGLIQKRMNDGTQKVLEDFESISDNSDSQ
jgi:hypothetical protein